jgi:hypothetical protein
VPTPQRDAAHRESLSNTLLSLRADAQRHATEHTRLSEKLVDTQRRLDGAEATERTLRQQLKAAETTAHKLKDEMAKMKALVAQSRAACANEVRKRDRQIDALKKATVDAGRVRGGARGRDVVTISVVGDTGAETRGGDGDGVARDGTSAEGYSLRMETNEFLTELAKGLSEENSLLLNLVRRTVDSLRDMAGLERRDAAAEDAARRSGNAIPPSQGSADELADELEGIMEHLRTILTNPSFVPIEEVEIREVEIARLREGWERMEARWKDAVCMMDSWRRRIASSGKPVDMEELQMGIRLSPVRVKDEPDVASHQDLYRQELSCVQEEEEEVEDYEDEDEDEVCQLEPPESRELAESLELVPAQNHENEGEDDYSEESSLFQDNVDMDDLEGEEPNVEILQLSTDANMESPPLPVPPQLSPLKDSSSSGNRRSHGDSNSRKRPGDFTTIVEERTWEVAAATDDVPPRPPPHAAKPTTTQKNLKPTPEGRPASIISRDSTLFGESYESPIRSNPNRKLFSKPSPVPSPDLQQPAKHEGQSEPAAKARKTKKADDIASATATSPEVKPVLSTRKTRSASKRVVSAPTVPSDKPARPAAVERLTACRPPPTTLNNKTSSNNSIVSSSRKRQPSPHQRTPSASSRLPTLRSQQAAVQQSPITMATIAAKLAASEREADAARVRAKLRAARSRTRANAPESAAVVPPTPARTSSGAAAPAVSPLPNASVDPVKRDLSPLPPRHSSHPTSAVPPPAPAPQKEETHDDDEDELVYTGRSPPRGGTGSAANTPHHRRTAAVERGSGRPEKRKCERRPSRVVSRRRSTLSPWELESLIQGNVDVESPAR